MISIAKFLLCALLGLLAFTASVLAVPQPPQEAPPQNPGVVQSPDASQGRGRGERRPGVMGKLTAVHDQSIEVTREDGSVVTVKITGDTHFRKERQEAKLSDLKIGDMVFIRGAENPDHTWNAEMVGERPAGGFGGRGPGGAEGGPRGGMRQMGVLGQDYVFGEVKSIDAPKLTILRPDNVAQTIELNEETSLRKGRDSITMADIQLGDHIMVRGATTNNVFQPRTLILIGPEQWKRIQEMQANVGPGANPPKDNNPQQKPPEPRN